MIKSKNKYEFKGAALVKVLIDRLNELGWDKNQAAEAIGITYPYLRALLNGARPLSGLSEDKLRNIAYLIRRTYAQTLMLAGSLRPEDFFEGQESAIKEQIDKAIEGMRRHPDWSNVAPNETEWESLSFNTKIGIVLMWERVFGQELIQKAPMIIVEREPEKANKKEKTS